MNSIHQASSCHPPHSSISETGPLNLHPDCFFFPNLLLFPQTNPNTFITFPYNFYLNTLAFFSTCQFEYSTMSLLYGLISFSNLKFLTLAKLLPSSIETSSFSIRSVLFPTIANTTHNKFF